HACTRATALSSSTGTRVMTSLGSVPRRRVRCSTRMVTLSQRHTKLLPVYNTTGMVSLSCARLLSAPALALSAPMVPLPLHLLPPRLLLHLFLPHLPPLHLLLLRLLPPHLPRPHLLPQPPRLRLARYPPPLHLLEAVCRRNGGNVVVSVGLDAPHALLALRAHPKPTTL
ncbi:hypothetical protein FRB96_008933, partial [Tulasnella sp. 330]